MQPYQRNFVLNGKVLSVNTFSKTRRRGRAPAHREVLAAHNNATAVHFAKAEDEICRIVTDELPGLIVDWRPSDRA